LEATDMRYITALVGGLLMFAGIVVISIFATPLLPPVFQRVITIGSGLFWLSAPIGVFIGIALGGLAATHSFRSTLKRYSTNTDEQSLNA